MSKHKQRIVNACLIALLGASNLYWWLRSRRLREGLATSHEWDGGEYDPAADPSASNSVILGEAAAKADVAPEDLVDQIEHMDDKIRAKQGEIDRLREGWAESWWDALAREPLPPGEPAVVVVELGSGDLDVARELALQATEVGDRIAIVVGRDGSVAVGTSEALADRFPAEEIADEITRDAGGGAGGTTTFATGGGDAEAVARAARDARDRIAAELDAERAEQ